MARRSGPLGPSMASLYPGQGTACPRSYGRGHLGGRAGGESSHLGAAVYLAHGKLILVRSTLRREKTRCRVWRGMSITAQFRYSPTSLPPFIAHKSPALPE